MADKAPACPRCRDTGWVFSRENNREKAVPCDCRDSEKRRKRAGESNIPSRFEKFNLKGYLPVKGNKSQEKTKKKAEWFVREYPAVPVGLILIGPTGVGKTRLLCSIGNELIRDKGTDVFYVDWNDLVRSMRSGEDANTRDYSSISALIQRMAGAELLLFDELGSSRPSPWVEDNIYYLINRRYNENRITLFASNFFDKTVMGEETLHERVGERIRSRIYEMAEAVEIQGFDYRKQYGGN